MILGLKNLQFFGSTPKILIETPLSLLEVYDLTANKPYRVLRLGHYLQRCCCNCQILLIYPDHSLSVVVFDTVYP